MTVRISPLQSVADITPMPRDLAETLRNAITKSGQPLLTIATKTGVGVASLSEFMAGADMRLTNASKVAKYLGLELKRKK